MQLEGFVSGVFQQYGSSSSNVGKRKTAKPTSPHVVALSICRRYLEQLLP